jgi:hypothetical protein
MPTAPSEPFDSLGFPASFRFERRQVYSPWPSGPLPMLAAVCDDPPVVVWLHRDVRNGVVECHVIEDESWIHFSFTDRTLEDEPSRYEWQFNREIMWSWDTAKSGPSPSRPDHLIKRNAAPIGARFAQLDEASRGRVIRLVQPVLEWWPEQYGADGPVLPNPTRRRIDFGPFRQALRAT